MPGPGLRSGGGVILAGVLLLVAAPLLARPSASPTPTATPVPAAARASATSSGVGRLPAAAPSPPAGLSPAAAGNAAATLAPSLDPIAAPIVVGAPLTLTGTGFTAGSVVRLFVATATGTVSYGPYTPTAWTATTLDWTVPAAVGLGRGFASVQVINTDQGFARSLARGQLLYGNAALNLPTILSIDGAALRPADARVPLASVDTVLAAGAIVTIGGSGFQAPRVNLFSVAGNLGPLTPLAGGSDTEIQIQIPAGAPTGPGSLQVINDPYTGNVVSNAVSAPIGAPIGISGVSQSGGVVTVTGSGFSPLTVINLFNTQGGGGANLGGLYPTNGQARIPLTIVDATTITFRAPPQGIPGPAFVQALNPPFTPFSSTGNDPDGAFALAVPIAAPGGSSLRFAGTGSGGVDRVTIPLDAPARPVDVGGDFTIEWWMKTAAGNASGACVSGGDGWINGNILIDRDVFGAGDHGDFGISLFGSGGRLAFGLAVGGTGTTICGSANVADGAWHHVAAVRSGSTLRLFVDGALDASGSGPAGDASYRDGRPTSHPESDPFLVLGAEKHDAGAAYPSYHGWLDELRVSRAVRYAGPFTPPAAPFTTDAQTAALYHFDEGNGLAVRDTGLAAGGPSDGSRRVGGAAGWPQWSTDTPFASGTPAIALDQLTAGLSAPTAITHCGDNRLFIAEQGGTIRIWNGTQLLPTPFLTVPTLAGGEQGLLGLAFHPRYAQTGFVYVDYVNGAGNLVIARYRVSGNPDVADPASGVVLRTITHPDTNHNGGQLQFGPDGFLYVGVGDGGGGCDSSGSGCNAQRDNLLLGKLLRLDVDQNVATPPYYGIPAGNPFAGAGDPLDEIWAKGLRNPWRFSFDRLTGGLFIADVGQSSREEVDYQDRGSGGGENYGWKVMEGSLCGTCSLSGCPATPACHSPALTSPILEYSHSAGCSVIGGYAYRGTAVPFLRGAYLYGDLCSGTLWWAKANGGAWTPTAFGITAGSLYTFGEDANGELYLGRGNGTLSRLVAP